jgi:hypothetical protein
MTDKTVAIEILKQLGGNKFIVMTGANTFTCSDYVMSFKFKMCPKTNVCRITLTPMDVYTMEFFRIRGTDFKPVEKFEGVYNDMLQDIFTQVTGLNTHL